MKYPVYIPSRGRADRQLTADLLNEAGIPFRVMVEPQEQDDYSHHLGHDKVLILPKSDQGTTYARNQIKEHAISEGHARHWQLDDNIRDFKMFHKGKRISIDPSIALEHTEQFVDQYTNVAIAGLMSAAFGHKITEPFSTNKQVYCCVLVQSDDFRWRGLGEDTDYSLQVLTSGLCTVLIKMYQIEKMSTGTMKGGNTDVYWKKEDARLERVRSLERRWPGLVKTTRRFGRTGQDLSHVWRKFDQPLIRKETE